MIAVIDYDAGNICSVMNALDRLGVQYMLTDQEQQIKCADKVIFPGVGHAGAAMNRLKHKGLDDVVKGLVQPVLGICVGMQLLATHSEEGNTQCLNIIPSRVRKFNAESGIKVPHMGWNKVSFNTEHALFEGVSNLDYLYFVHSYYMEHNDCCIASAGYGIDFCSAVQKDNFYGIQFHAEKSGSIGAAILANFINYIK